MVLKNLRRYGSFIKNNLRMVRIFTFSLPYRKFLVRANKFVGELVLVLGKVPKTR
ncbi:hypothetical protein Patl1_37083 [Pistacia atlantica]|nr:hypothetical protein Patl1_37083 [Pistacia atlantica]